MLLLLQDLEGDSFDIPPKFDKLWVDNCPDFKTVPAHIIELNVRNCASFKKVPKTVQYLAVYNCPLLDKNKIKKQINYMDILLELRAKSNLIALKKVSFIQSNFTKQRSIKMTDKETEIKALVGIIFELKAKLATIGMMNANGSFEERKKLHEEDSWFHYQIAVAENMLKAAATI